MEALNKETLLKQISRIENVIKNPGMMSAGAIANMQKNLVKLKEDLAQFDKAPEIAVKQTEDAVEDLDELIEKIEKKLKGTMPDAVRKINQKKLDDAKAKKAQAQKEIKEEKNEIVESVKEVKTAVTEINTVVKDAIKVVEKSEKKVEVKEETIEDLDALIKKLENIISGSAPKSVKIINQKKLDDAKDRRSKLVGEVKEIKQEVKEVVQEAKEIVKENKQIIKDAKVDVSAPKKKKKISNLRKKVSELEKLIENVKSLRTKYQGKGVDLKRDSARSAKPFGYRFTGPKDYRVPTASQIEKGKLRGNIDYETRPNRSDKYPEGYKGKIKLKKGGKVEKSTTKKKVGRKSICYCWTKEAVKDGVITASEMNDKPSLYMRKKYPAYVTVKK